MKKKDIGTEEVLYRFGLVAALVAASGYLFLQLAPDSLREWISRYSFCVIYRLTGFTCPGCGGSRAVSALLHGRVLLSILYHPLVLYGVVLYGTFMLSHTAAKMAAIRYCGRWCSRKSGFLKQGKMTPAEASAWKRTGMKWKNGYATAAVWLLVGNFIIKNMIYLMTGIDVLTVLDSLYAVQY